MKVTSVRILLSNVPPVVGYASIVLDDCFAVNGIRIIKDSKGRVIIAMPSKKATKRCTNCGATNDFDIKYCGKCGQSLPEVNVPVKFKDIAHPINTVCRKEIEDAIKAEMKKVQI